MIYKATCVVILMLLASAHLISAQQDDFPVLKGPYLGQEPPGDTPVLFAPGIVSTGKEHSAAMFTPDGNEIWFGRMFPEEIYYMRRINEKWTEPQILSFGDTFKYLYPVLTHDGNRLFFSSDRPIEKDEQRLPRGAVDIWMIERNAEGWLKPKHLDNNINRGQRSSCGSVSSDGKLYFTTKTENKSHDIFCSKFIKNGYTIPESLADLNSPTPDHCPFIAADGSHLIFSSFRGGLGRSDLFISFRDQNGAWSEPKNMGPTINSAYKDEYPYVTPDGKYLFFNSNRPSSLNKKVIEDGPGNIYWVSARIVERLRPKN